MTEQIIRKRSLVNQVKDLADITPKKDEHFDTSSLISTGNTILDLCCSDSIGGGFLPGRMVNLIGDSSSGKTILCLSLLAEACNNEKFDDYRIIFDDVEAAMSFDIEKLFGTKLAERIDAPNTDENDEPLYSDTIQQFQYNVTKALDGDLPVIYILDSFDALSSDEEIRRLDDAIEAYDKGKETKGTYAMEKAKVGGRALAMIVRKLKQSKSMVVIISQTRDNIDPMSFNKKTRSGGKALKFYATHEIWMACGKKIKSKDRVIGVEAIAKVTKNKLTGKIRDCSFNVFYDYGVDDIGSCVDFLVNEGHWKKKALTIDAVELGISGTRDKLIRTIESERIVGRLKKIVGKVWGGIEESLKLGREPKYN